MNRELLLTLGLIDEKNFIKVPGVDLVIQPPSYSLGAYPKSAEAFLPNKKEMLHIIEHMDHINSILSALGIEPFDFSSPVWLNVDQGFESRCKQTAGINNNKFEFLFSNEHYLYHYFFVFRLK